MIFIYCSISFLLNIKLLIIVGYYKIGYMLDPYAVALLMCY